MWSKAEMITVGEVKVGMAIDFTNGSIPVAMLNETNDGLVEVIYGPRSDTYVSRTVPMPKDGHIFVNRWMPDFDNTCVRCGNHPSICGC